jgi:hypothetical protein
VTSRLIRAGDALSQLLNVLIFDGDPNYSVSGDAFRLRRERLRYVIDLLASPWEPDHCLLAYANDVAKAKKLLLDCNHVTTRP